MVVKNQLTIADQFNSKPSNREKSDNKILPYTAVCQRVSESRETVQSLFAIVQCFRSRLWSLKRESNTYIISQLNLLLSMHSYIYLSTLDLSVVDTEAPVLVILLLGAVHVHLDDERDDRGVDHGVSGGVGVTVQPTAAVSAEMTVSCLCRIWSRLCL